MRRILKSLIRQEYRRWFSRDLRGPCDKLRECLAWILSGRVQSTRVASSDIKLKHDVMNVHYKSGVFPVWGPRRRVDTRLCVTLYSISL